MNRKQKAVYNNEFDVIIIGGGLGGLSAAAILSNSGYKILLVEKSKNLGGRFSSYERNGFITDVGTHIITRCTTGPYNEVLKRSHYPHRIDFQLLTKENPPTIRFYNKEVILPYKQFISLDELSRVLVELDFNSEEQKKTANLLSRIISISLKRTHKYDDIDFKTFINQYSINKKTVSLVGSLAMPLFGIPYWEISAGEAIRALQNWFNDACSGYPKGGCIAVPSIYERAINLGKGLIKKGVNVKKIEISDGNLKGVLLDDGSYFVSKIILSNLGLKDTVLSLIGEKYFEKEYITYVKNLKEPSMSTIQVKIALDKKITRQPCVMGSPDHEIDLDQVYIDTMKDVIPQNYNGIAVIPSNIDGTLAPPGKQLVLAMTLSPLKSNKWDKWIDFCYEGTEKLLPGLSKYELWKDSFTPLHISKITGRKSSSSLGLAQIPSQVAQNRPSCISPIPGLFFVGDDTGINGICSELAIDSALNCVNHIVVNFKKKMRGNSIPIGS